MLKFLVIGDWGRKGMYRQQETADQMAVSASLVGADFVISTGDNFYDAGVESIHDPDWQLSFENIYKAPALQIPWYCILGNHDYDGNIQAQIDYTTISSRWNLPAPYYHITKNIGQDEVLFVFTDTSPFIFEYYFNPKPAVISQNKEQQLKWLEQTLAQSQAKWKIVVGHHPIYSSSPFHGDAPELIDAFVPLFNKYGVDLYLAGHEHDLQLQKPQGNTYYLVSGAGSEIRETEAYAFTEFSASSNGFALIGLDQTTLKIEFVNDHGKILFRKLIHKGQ